MEPESQEVTAADVGSLDDVVEPPPEDTGPPLAETIPLSPDGPEAELVRRVAEALPKVFTFMDSNQWDVAAGNLVRRLSLTSGEGPNDLRLI